MVKDMVVGVQMHKSFIPWSVRAPSRKRVRTRDYKKALIQERWMIETATSIEGSVYTLHCPMCGGANNFPRIRHISTEEFFTPLYMDLSVSRARLRAIVRGGVVDVPAVWHKCFSCGWTFHRLLLENDVCYKQSENGSGIEFVLRTPSYRASMLVSLRLYDMYEGRNEVWKLAEEIRLDMIRKCEETTSKL